MKLTNVNLLEELASPSFADILPLFNEKTFSKNAIIFSPSDDDMERVGGPLATLEMDEAPQHAASLYNYVFIVRTGRIRVYLSCDDKEFTVAVLKPGDLFVSHSSAFVQALEESKILLIDTPTFNKRMMSLHQVSISVVRVLGGMLQNSFSIIDGLALRDSSGRLARYLLENSSQGADGELVVQLALSGEMLAQTLGASRQTVSTLLSDFTRAGVLQKVRRGVYIILDDARLRELVL